MVNKNSGTGAQLIYIWPAKKVYCRYVIVYYSI